MAATPDFGNNPRPQDYKKIVDVAPSNHNIWVYPPESIREIDDPYDDDHHADTWGEALEMLQDYKKIIDTVAQYQWASSPIALPND